MKHVLYHYCNIDINSYKTLKINYKWKNFSGIHHVSHIHIQNIHITP